MEITGSFAADNTMIGTSREGSSYGPDGAFYGQELGNYDLNSDDKKNGGRLIFKASRSWTGATASNGSHTHSVTIAKTDMTTASAGAHTHSVSITVPKQTMTSASAGAHTHNLSGATASAGAHTHTTSGTAASAGAHTHTATTASAGSHTHTITVQTAGVHQHGVTVQTAGGSASFNIMPPYLAVNVWKRTA